MASAQAEIQYLLRRDPHTCGLEHSRWTLANVRQVCAWLCAHSLPGVYQILSRLGLHLKRGRDYLHSPDPAYLGKLASVQVCVKAATTSSGLKVLLFEDEFTYHRQPTAARDYVAQGSPTPLARRSYRSDTTRRIVATLDALSGRVLYRQRSQITLTTLVEFYAQVRDSYPEADLIYLVQDNWPVHFHPDVLAALVPQQCPWPWHRPGHWNPQPRPQAKRLNLPIQLVPLPTYASWTNPIEKLWRWLKQDLLHLHRYADRWSELQTLVSHFLDQFAEGSQALLRYVGLQEVSHLYQHAFSSAISRSVT